MEKPINSNGASVLPDETLPVVPAYVDDHDHALWHALLRLFLKTPTEQELRSWSTLIGENLTARQFLNRVTRSKRFAATKFVRMKNEPGHFFSPVVDPDSVRDYVNFARSAKVSDIKGIEFPLDKMEEFWNKNRDFIARTPFTEERNKQHRYFYSGGPFGYGDAITARAMINEYRPKRIVEIGSGFSSACMLDAADHVGLTELKMICIEPFPNRLRSILRESDDSIVEIMERGVQQTPLEIFRALEAGDILFIDSTHVCKTGSDVHYELFYILPALRPGVIVHFHDVRFPFEYSDTQIFTKNYSWNEAYAVRALLMYSIKFKILFSGSLFALERSELVTNTISKFMINPGSSLWVRVC